MEQLSTWRLYFVKAGIPEKQRCEVVVAYDEQEDFLSCLTTGNPWIGRHGVLGRQSADSWHLVSGLKVEAGGSR